MTDQTILQETLDNNIVDGDWLIYWKTSTGVQRRVARSSLLGATLTGAGTIATGGFTLTVPATGTAALKIGTPVANNVAQWDNANAVEDAGFAASNVALLDGSRSLTADWDIGDNRRVLADGLRARDGAGLRLEDDAGNLVVLVADDGNVGIGTSVPDTKLEIRGVSPVLRLRDSQSLGSGEWPGTILGGVEFFTSDNTVPQIGVAGAIRTYSAPDLGTAAPYATMGFFLRSNVEPAPEIMTIRHNGRVGIGTTTPEATLHAVQSSATANIPTLRLEQADVSEEFIRFDSTVGAGNAIDTAALGSYYGKIRVHVEGVGDKFIALYNT